MKAKLSTISYFLKTGIWLAPDGNLSKVKKFSVSLLKVILLAIRGYSKNNLGVRVSALTFYTFLSLVPIVAVAFGIAKGFGFEKILRSTLMSVFAQQEDIMEMVFLYADTMIKSTSGGVVAGAGFIILIWAIIKLLSAVEEAFNTVWGVPEPRSAGRKAADYLSFSLIGPIFFIMATSVTFTLMAHVESIAIKAATWGVPSALITLPLRLIPFVLIWTLFSFIIIWMPNTHVQWKTGIFAGIIAGTSYQLIQWAYFALQIGVSRNNAIYGSLAAIPLFLAWMQISWTIVLIGCEISHATQELDTLGFPTQPEEINPRHRKVLAVLVLHEIAKRFKEGTQRLTSKEIAAKLKAPSCLTNNILSSLASAGLVTAVKPSWKNSKETWQPGRDIHQLTIASTLDALDRDGTIELDSLMSPEFRSTLKTLEEFSQTIESSPANRPILSL
ncbi:MAG: YihY/virulence factor BrkB family protein [Syntrophorhabdaceae bacterium]|nr:YihY/virulence factor BrkB family protein [Syntrophorhabdaceae bacterium]